MVESIRLRRSLESRSTLYPRNFNSSQFELARHTKRNVAGAATATAYSRADWLILKIRFPRKYPRYSSAISREIRRSVALRGRAARMYNIRMKTPRAKGKRASSFKEHICSLVPAVKFARGRKFRRYKDRIMCRGSDSLCPFHLPRGATRPRRYRRLENVSKI